MDVDPRGRPIDRGFEGTVYGVIISAYVSTPPAAGQLLTVTLNGEHIGVVSIHHGSTGRAKPQWRFSAIGTDGVRTRRRDAVQALVDYHRATTSADPAGGDHG